MDFFDLLEKKAHDTMQASDGESSRADTMITPISSSTTTTALGVKMGAFIFRSSPGGERAPNNEQVVSHVALPSLAISETK